MSSGDQYKYIINILSICNIQVSLDHMSNLPAINIMHIAAIAPFLAYVGWQNKLASEGKIGVAGLRKIGMALMIIAMVIVIYHSYRLYGRITKSDGDVIKIDGTSVTKNAPFTKSEGCCDDKKSV